MRYGFSKTLTLDFDQALTRVTDELKKEGFGVLTTIDVQDTLKKKLDVPFKRYTILGACNPPFAHQALQAEEEIGLLLPCNVIVYEQGNATTVAAFDPMIMSTILEKPHIRPIAEQVKQRLERVMAAL
jgi:uncharacterized protein (DUF302 family)